MHFEAANLMAGQFTESLRRSRKYRRWCLEHGEEPPDLTEFFRQE